MGNNLTNRIGWACKTLDENGNNIPELNFRSTTISWLNRQPREVAVARLWEIMQHNIAATRAAIVYASKQVPELRMMRVGSDMLPAYTESNWSWFWKQPEIRNYLERELAPVGNLAREFDVRLSMHPGQFCCIVSDNQDVVGRSIEEFEYHTDLARWMGYGSKKLDFKINIHLSGKLGVDGFDTAWNKLSTEARNCLTLENDEYQASIDNLLVLKDKVGIVLDIHHHHINCGEYIQPDDDRIKYILDSWQGVRPTMHYSLSREDVLTNHDSDTLPDMKLLLEQGYKKAKLRAHSDMMWNTAANKWALSFNDKFDIMVEAKNKNLASFKLYEYSLTL